MFLHVDIIPNRKSRSTILLREARREGKRIRKKTLCNLTHVPSIIVDGIRAMLKVAVVYKDFREVFSIKRNLPHGHVVAALGVSRNLGLDHVLHRKNSRTRDLALGAVVLRVLKLNSKLVASRGLSPESASTSLGAQVEKIQQRFGVENVALVGDRGMITTARIRENIESCGLERISALKTTNIRKLLKKPEDGEAPLSPEALVPEGVGEILNPQFPGERLIVCLNPRLREQRARKREELLVSTERILKDIRKAVRRKGSSLRGKDNINRRVGCEANRRNVEKHFEITVTDDDISWSRDREKIEAEARLDGIYIIRTSLAVRLLERREWYRRTRVSLWLSGRFRSIKTTSLRIRPFCVYSEPHVRGHVLLCMLAYYVEWHLLPQ